jgi:hypothetical protein
MLQDTLKQLVEDIGSDRYKYVGKWEGMPERVKNWFESSAATSCMK